ncbi:predicted protein [Thalassiosira pseudonana CCMP1335]|uniref:Uncharacterized protein n=1 Tax=Thalassiosira pseudonana TaxID=35128 RepID=B8BVF5_THAPS|nr:predicted protein [Thalassiosira pseudonana CCMP1335]EED94925.1 predicted protein [Thalassiosira pseudonana CCMP1335]
MHHQEDLHDQMGVPAIGKMNLPPPVVDPDDPLLIAQTLTYVTDDGSVLLSFTSAPFSFAFKLRFFLFEAIFLAILIVALPIGAHGTVVSISIGNLIAVAWFWYNSVRCVDITSDGGLRFWIGNIEIDVPFDKIGIVDQPYRWSGDIDECSEHAVLGMAEECGTTGEEFGTVEVSEVENLFFACGWGVEFY